MAAWHCVKREPERVGRRFKLDDCIRWMRLMFWSAREEGLLENQPFRAWFVPFISHFIRVYEQSAPPFTEEALKWSENPKNIESYLENQRIMVDL